MACGYPLIREARHMVRTGQLGEIRLVQAEYVQDWLADPLEHMDKKAAWRTDPESTGGGGHWRYWDSRLQPRPFCNRALGQ